MSNPNNKSEDALYQRVSRIIKAGRSQVSRSVNTAMVHAYWLIGREIVEVEQEGKERAGYGEQVLRRLADRLSVRFGRGFSYPNIKRMRQFYLTFRCGTSVPPDLGGPRTGASLQYILPASEKGSTVSSLSTLAGIGSTPLGQFIGDNPYRLSALRTSR